MVQEKEVKFKIIKILGSASIFKQGGSLRLVIPKRALAYLKMPKDPDESEFSTVILIVTDRGILMRPLSDLLQDDEMKNL